MAESNDTTTKAQGTLRFFVRGLGDPFRGDRLFHDHSWLTPSPTTLTHFRSYRFWVNFYSELSSFHRHQTFSDGGFQNPEVVILVIRPFVRLDQRAELG